MTSPNSEPLVYYYCLSNYEVYQKHYILSLIVAAYQCRQHISAVFHRICLARSLLSAKVEDLLCFGEVGAAQRIVDKVYL